MRPGAWRYPSRVDVIYRLWHSATPVHPTLTRQTSLPRRQAPVVCSRILLKENFQGHKRMAHARERDTRARKISVRCRGLRAARASTPSSWSCEMSPPAPRTKTDTCHARRTRPPRAALGTLAARAAPHTDTPHLSGRATLATPQGATVLNVWTQNILLTVIPFTDRIYALQIQRMSLKVLRPTILRLRLRFDATVLDDHSRRRLATGRADSLHRSDHIHAAYHLRRRAE